MCCKKLFTCLNSSFMNNGCFFLTKKTCWENPSSVGGVQTWQKLRFLLFRHHQSCLRVQRRSWAKWFFFWGGGGQLGRAKLGGSGGEKPWNFLKFPFLNSLQMHPILKTSSYIWGSHLLLRWWWCLLWKQPCWNRIDGDRAKVQTSHALVEHASQQVCTFITFMVLWSLPVPFQT